MELSDNRDLTTLVSDAPSEKTLKILRDFANALAAAVEAVEAAQSADVGAGLSFYEEVQRFEKALIQRALKYTGGNQSQAARLLGLKQSTLHGKIKQYRIQQSVLIFNNEQFEGPGK